MNTETILKPKNEESVFLNRLKEAKKFMNEKRGTNALIRAEYAEHNKMLKQNQNNKSTLKNWKKQNEN